MSLLERAKDALKEYNEEMTSLKLEEDGSIRKQCRADFGIEPEEIVDGRFSLEGIPFTAERCDLVEMGCPRNRVWHWRIRDLCPKCGNTFCSYPNDESGIHDLAELGSILEGYPWNHKCGNCQ